MTGTAPAREHDPLAVCREGMMEWCDKNKAEIMAFVVLHWQADIRMMLAELLSIRGGKE